MLLAVPQPRGSFPPAPAVPLPDGTGAHGLAPQLQVRVAHFATGRSSRLLHSNIEPS
jgi:hypothetical protein